MLIEFCCPVCKAPLALNKQVIGGQVNCPNCQRLILLPAESPLPRKDKQTPPFQKDQTYSAEEVAGSICISIEPYRRDLENKSNLLNDAVEMVKIRNERIRDIESLMLNTQKELWELEIAVEELIGNSNFPPIEPDDHSAGVQEENPEQTEKIETLIEKKEKLKARLANMVEHSENLDGNLKEARKMLQKDGPTCELIAAVTENFNRQLERSEDQQRDLDLASEYLQQASEELVRLCQLVGQKEDQRKQLQEILSSSSEQMELAVQERNQWRKKGSELEKQYMEQAEKLTTLKLQVTEFEKLQQEWSEDKDHSKRLRGELEENLELLRARIEQERATHQETLKDREEKLKADAQKKIATLEKKLKSANSELDVTEEKLAISLQTQQQLAEQNMQSEQQRRKLKAEMDVLQDQVDAAE